MSQQSFLLSLLIASSSVVSARHLHERPNHKHEARQAGGAAIPVFTQAVASPIPVIAPAPVTTPNLGGLADELETCLSSIPKDIAALMGAIDQRLQDVQSQVNSILNGNLPSTSIPIITPTPFIPTGIPSLSISLPPLSFPSPVIQTAISGVPSVASVPTVSVPSLSLPAFSLPSPQLPTTSVPPFSMPLMQLPPQFAPTSALPSISAPTVPSASLPTGVVPAVSFAPFSPPSLALPTTSIPAVSVPVVSLPSPSLPTTSVPPFSLPPFSVPQPTVQFVPPISTPVVAAPSIATVPTLQAPALSAPTVATPAVQSPSLLGQVTVPSLNTKLPVSAPTVPMSLVTVTDLLSSSRASSMPSSTPYIFNADARDNVAVYYGNTPATAPGGLAQVCLNRNVDLVVISFVYDFFSENGYPSLFFGTSSCTGQTDAQAARAPGLRNCPPLAQQITACQGAGKKVLVSLGGYIANSSFTSDLEAKQFAVTLWNLFGGGKTQDQDLRPFGSNVVVDGFDIDNEDGSTAYWDTFATSMRALFNSDTSKRYYLSAAPQCPFPDASIPMSALQQVDFVWTQFYNNPACNLDSAGFQSSFTQWSNALAAAGSKTSPKLYIGAAAFPDAGSGYVSSSALSTRVSLAKSLFKSNFGGIMLWDGSEALQNYDTYDNTYLDYSKWALEY